ncbi:MAG: PAS domain S-box protein [Candidatus Saccharibacteria bacterium]
MKIENSTYSNSLREKAEKLLEDRQAVNDSTYRFSADDSYNKSTEELIHEILLQKTELEIQNEQLQSALGQSQTPLGDLNLLTACCFILDQNGTICQINDAAASIMGFEKDQITGSNFRQYITSGNEYLFNNFLRGIFKTPTKKTCEIYLKSNRQSAVCLHLEGNVTPAGDQCQVIAFDMTERKKREDALEQTQQNFISLVNNRDESIWSIDNNFHIIIYNNFFRDECFAAYNVEIKKGMNVLNIFPSHLHHLWKQKYTRALSGRRVVFEYSNQVGDELHDYEVFLNPVFSNKKVTGVTALSVIVTWRKHAEEALRNSEERHRLLADNAADVISIMDIDGRFTYVSPSVKKLTGHVPAELLNSSFREICTEESVEKVQYVLATAREAMQSGEIMDEFRNEMQLWGKDGSKIWVEVTTSAMYNKIGEFVGILSVTRDINERKMAELALRCSEIKYRSLYESIMDGFACINMEGHIIDCNDSFEQMVGYSREELMKLHFSDIIPEKWHETEKYILKNQIIPKGYSDVYEEEFIRKDGSVFPVELRIFAVKNESGEMERMCGIIRDITEQKQAQEELSKSEQLYHSLFEKSNAVMFLIDPTTGAIVDTNNAACKYYGYSREQLNSFNITDINMVAQSQVLSSMAEIVQGKPLHFNYRHKLADSSIRDVEVYSSPIEIEGRILLHSIIHDITDRKIAEEALIASEARFRNLLQNVSAVAVQGYSPDGRIQYWNHASEQLYGYSAQEAIGRNIVKLIVSPEMQQQSVCDIQEMVETGKPVASGEMSLIRRNGSRIDVYTSHAIVQIPGRLPELFCFDIDLTERNQAQQKVRESNEIFRQFLENSPIYIFFKDEHSRMLQLSRNYEELFGRKMEEIIGKTMAEIDPETFKNELGTDDGRILKEGIKIEGEDEILGRYFSTIKFPITIQGRTVNIAGFRIDITERKKAEKALMENETRLKELNATKDKFFSIIAHDLKGPFNSIIGFSDLLIRQIQERDYEGIGRYAMIIKNSSQRAMNLLLNLLEWSRSQTGSMEFKPEEINMSSLIQEAVQLFMDAARQKSITLYTMVPQENMVFVDRPMVLTVLRNLISNAIKFTHSGGEILISTKCTESECEVMVSDNGVGIKKEAIEKLFHIHTSYSTIGTNDEVGTGLGLILCKDFVDKHKGKIWVESIRGSKIERGSTIFHFTIPRFGMPNA